MTAFSNDVAIVTPWYPSLLRPFLGAFVQAMVESTAPDYDRMAVYHCDEWAVRHTAKQDARVMRAHYKLMPTTLRPQPTKSGASLLRLPVPVPIGTPYAEIAQRHAETLRVGLSGGVIDAPVVHAHVGLPGGWAALRNAHPDARVFVTEHATFLDSVLAQPQARKMYDELLHRCAGFFAVGRAVHDPLVKAFPHHADRIGYIPNPVSFDVTRATPVTELNRWIFVGGLIPRKGVMRLLEAFAICRAENPALTLTFVGEGTQLGELTARAAELGVTEAIRFTGGVPPEEALRLMREHDLLVHPSQFETFGMTIVEAAAAGLPVLVTRCGGPEETLMGIEEAAGELVEVEDDPESLAAGYRRLRARFEAGIDLAGARVALAKRYGYDASAEAHRRAWFPDGSTTVARVPESRPPADDLVGPRSVLFLAIGGTRKRVVIEESAQVVADGGHAVVVVENAIDWRKETFAAGVRVVELAKLKMVGFPTSVEQLVMFRGPRFAFRALGRGPLQSWSRRGAKAYERGVAEPIHRQLWLPVERRLRNRGVQDRLVRHHILGRTAFDLIVISDPVSIPVAARLVATDPTAPPVGYGLTRAIPIDSMAHSS